MRCATLAEPARNSRLAASASSTTCRRPSSTGAVAVAKAIHCQANADDFCGQCVNCARITDGNHPDVRTVAPLADKKEISIQQIREIERELNYRSFTGKRKIVIIDPAILLNAAAQNALLKTLEEPPQESF